MMVDQSFAGTLAYLRDADDLHVVERRVSAIYELGEVLKLRQFDKPQLFANVEGASMGVVGNLMNTRDRMARLLGADRAGLANRILAALGNPIPPVMVEDAPLREVIHRDGIDLPSLLPVPKWFEHEGGPYITAGVIVARDPETGKRNISIARLRLEGGGRVLAGIAKNHHLSLLAEKARSRNEKLPIAVAIGNHPAVLVGSQMYLDLGADEYDTVGGLLGAPLELISCLTVPLEVPAGADIVLEGYLEPENLIDEGSVSEFHDFYVNYGSGMGGVITCVTHRANAVYQAILPGYAPEHCLLGAVAIEAVCYVALARVIPCVRRVLVTDGGMGRLHVVISMHRPKLGEGKRAAILAMGQINLFKQVIVVEDDIDIEDPRQVEWSMAARFRGDADMVVIPGIKSDRCDPLHEHLTVTKIAYIATTRPGDGERSSRSEFVRVPAAVAERVRKTLAEY